MKLKPIAFKANLVRAILDGKKTVTRRIAHEDKSPKYSTGDTLYIREAFAVLGAPPNIDILYKADFPNDPREGTNTPRPQWRPAIHMPKNIARLILTITGVRKEKLLKITEEGAKAEGCEVRQEFATPFFMSARENFKNLWNDIYLLKGLGWETNPEVYVYEFEVKKRERKLKI